jgi:Tol biopolymer transport system component
MTLVGGVGAAEANRGDGDSGDALPLKPGRTVKFTTDEGTWISVDVSPDGKTIVFDLIGNLYTMPIGGGKATKIASDGLAFDGQPRFSPDGRSIVFTSDRNGSCNVWIVDADGRNPRAVTRAKDLEFTSPAWTPDGNAIAVIQRPGLEDGPHSLYLYDLRGGAGFRLPHPGEAERNVDRLAGLQELGLQYKGPTFARDSRYMFFSSSAQGDALSTLVSSGFGSWQVHSFDPETGKVLQLTHRPGGAIRPVVSPDGRLLVYGTRTAQETSLELMNLQTHEIKTLVPLTQRDAQDAGSGETAYDSRDLLPGSAFTPDGAALITSFGGKIWRVEVPAGKVSPVAFSVDVERQIGPFARFEYHIPSGPITAQQIRYPRPSPDGKKLAFTALDRVWVMDLPNGTPHRVTKAEVGEYSPSWSPDGNYIAYTTWTDLDGGRVYRVRADGGEEPKLLTPDVGFYDKPEYSPDGTKLLVVFAPRSERLLNQESNPNIDEVLGWIPADGGRFTEITHISNPGLYSYIPFMTYGQAHFVGGGEHVYFHDAKDGLVSVRLDGTGRRSLLKVSWEGHEADEVLLSPKGDCALALVRQEVFLIDVPRGVWPSISVDVGAPAAVRVQRITRVAGDFIGWLHGGDAFYFSLGHAYFTYNLAAAAEAKRHAGASQQGNGEWDRKIVVAPGYEPNRIDVAAVIPRDTPSGVVVLQGGRIITMHGDDVIENGDVVVRDDHIVGVGKHGAVQIPAGAKIIDVRGKTLLPGWVDMHPHIRPMWGVHHMQPWEYLSTLAFGTTTTRDPSTITSDVLTWSDQVSAGMMLGPRIYSTVMSLPRIGKITSMNDARDVLRTYSEFFSNETIKQYETGDRQLRQWVIEAAREQHLTSTTEGGGNFVLNLTQMIDGYPAQEHSWPITPIYKDVVQLVVQSDLIDTPTIGDVESGWGYYGRQIEASQMDKIKRFDARYSVSTRQFLRERDYYNLESYTFPRKAADFAKVIAAGGKVALGSHGDSGQATQADIWGIASGGMPRMEVLRSCTLSAAEAMGHKGDIGSVEVGKFADLQVLDKNPLDDIANTLSIRYVMKNGRLYDANTLDEVWPRQRKLPGQWWNKNDGLFGGDERFTRP